jgi:glucokinase
VVRKAREAIAAGKSPALAEAAKRTPLTSSLVHDVANLGVFASREIFRSVGRYLGIGLAGLVNALNLPLYVIGGGAAAAWDLFAPAMIEELGRRSYIYLEGSTRVERSVLKGDAGVLGAASLAFQ